MALRDRRFIATLGSLSLALAVDCSPSETQVAVERAPEFRRANPAVSILGVYKDGRMNTEGWGAVAPELEKAFRGGRCYAAFSESFVFAHADLAAAVDDYTRAIGPTSDLIAALAPAARGDVVLVVTLAGHAPARERVSLAAAESAKGSHGGASDAHRRGRRQEALDIGAAFFSARDGRQVGSVALEYTGPNGDAALSSFAARLAATWPDATCAGWNWNAVDGVADRVRVLPRDP